MRLLVLGTLLALAGCGGGGTTGTNYSDAPPMAEIVGTPAPKPSETPTPEATATEAAADNAVAVENGFEDEVGANEAE